MTDDELRSEFRAIHQRLDGLDGKAGRIAIEMSALRVDIEIMKDLLGCRTALDMIKRVRSGESSQGVQA